MNPALALIRQMFHKHDWKLNESQRYSAIRRDGSKEGEVTLLSVECTKCGKEALIPEDRTHDKAA